MDSRSAGSSETTVPPRRSIRIRNKALLQTLPRELKHDPLAYSVDHKALRNAVGRKRKSPDAAAAKTILETLSLPWMLDKYFSPWFLSSIFSFSNIAIHFSFQKDMKKHHCIGQLYTVTGQ